MAGLRQFSVRFVTQRTFIYFRPRCPRAGGHTKGSLPAASPARLCLQPWAPAGAPFRPEESASTSLCKFGPFMDLTCDFIDFNRLLGLANIRTRSSGYPDLSVRPACERAGAAGGRAPQFFRQCSLKNSASRGSPSTSASFPT